MELTSVLPHRWPVLLLDRVADVEPGVSLSGFLTIRADQPWYADHFPPYLVLESWLQAAAVLGRWKVPHHDIPVLVGRVRGVRFLRRAFTEETVHHRVRIVKTAAGLSICSGISTIAESAVLEVDQVTVSFGGGIR
ncbi:hypothetical protein IRT45_20760 [Nocardia sp. BSTN01]|uniref:3-hydroxyacyl-ACP dehydratase FabZ family protein n=1 Tax=Nocardia sp. BSTN01 TaxID=2783665 RepID=UPI00188F8A37|nr:hypothetical protein [Nocardia sp. BSTN01]MBF4999580.1 hypothetical protein [Nocardia sp. BSTN01]